MTFQVAALNRLRLELIARLWREGLGLFLLSYLDPKQYQEKGQQEEEVYTSLCLNRKFHEFERISKLLFRKRVVTILREEFVD